MPATIIGLSTRGDDFFHAKYMQNGHGIAHQAPLDSVLFPIQSDCGWGEVWAGFCYVHSFGRIACKHGLVQAPRPRPTVVFPTFSVLAQGGYKGRWRGAFVVWCGVVWCRVVWCGVVWCGVVWCGVVWCGVVWCGVVWCGVVWCGVVWCGVVWCGVVWCGVTEDSFSRQYLWLSFVSVPLLKVLPPPPLYKLRPCPSYSGCRDRINLVPNLIRYKCSAAT